MLDNPTRDRLLADFERDGFVVLPTKLPADLLADALSAIDRIAAEDRRVNPEVKSVK
jgi:hypothetical protein